LTAHQSFVAALEIDLKTKLTLYWALGIFIDLLNYKLQLTVPSSKQKIVKAHK